MSTNRNSTKRIELAETDNIARCINRIRMATNGPDYRMAWRRALYHAVGLANLDESTQRRIREALELP